MFIFIGCSVCILIDEGLFSEWNTKHRDFSEENGNQRWAKLAVSRFEGNGDFLNFPCIGISLDFFSEMLEINLEPGTL